MGLFKSIGKFFKKIVKGVKKIFDKTIGKLLGSKIGKAIMIVAGVISMGTALAAGVTAWNAVPASKGLLAKFVAAGGDFVRSLVGAQTKFGDKAVTAGGTAELPAGQQQVARGLQEAGAQGAELVEQVSGASPIKQTVEAAVPGLGGEQGVLAGLTEPAAAQAAGGAQAGTVAPGKLLQGAKDFFGGVAQGAQKQVQTVAEKAGQVGETIPTTGVGTGLPGAPFPGAAPSIAGRAGQAVGQAGRAAFGFATSTGGGLLLGNVLQGYGQGKMLEEQRKEERRERDELDRRWQSYRWQDEDFDIGLGEGWRQRALRTSGDLNRPRSGFFPGGGSFAGAGASSKF